ncbi:hypothetical protein CBL_07925 [Carabus blaptoides fortunei]
MAEVTAHSSYIPDRQSLWIGVNCFNHKFTQPTENISEPAVTGQYRYGYDTLDSSYQQAAALVTEEYGECFRTQVNEIGQLFTSFAALIHMCRVAHHAHNLSQALTCSNGGYRI